MRFSLRWLFGLVFYAAAGCALLVCEYASLDPFCVVVFAALCLIALIGSIYSRGEQRAFWGGFAIVALSFMLSGMLPRNDQTPHGAVGGLLRHVCRKYETGPGPISNLDSVGVQTFVAIGCSIAGGLLACKFRSQRTKS